MLKREPKHRQPRDHRTIELFQFAKDGYADAVRNDLRPASYEDEELAMIVLGIILCIIGWATGISVLYTVGSILLAIGLIFLVLGLFGRPIAGRQWY